MALLRRELHRRPRLPPAGQRPVPAAHGRGGAHVADEHRSSRWRAASPPPTSASRSTLAPSGSIEGSAFDLRAPGEVARAPLQLVRPYNALSPLEPRYVSTVDSGNLAAALTALAAGLIEYGRPDLAARAQALRRGMDFSALYVKRRRLFSIGYDAAKGALGRGCYDLLASEDAAHGPITPSRAARPRPGTGVSSRAPSWAGTATAASRAGRAPCSST